MAGRYNGTSAVGEASVSVSLPGAAARPSPAAAFTGSDGRRLRCEKLVDAFAGKKKKKTGPRAFMQMQGGGESRRKKISIAQSGVLARRHERLRYVTVHLEDV